MGSGLAYNDGLDWSLIILMRSADMFSRVAPELGMAIRDSVVSQGHKPQV